jgi:serine/threonine protein kinase
LLDYKKRRNDETTDLFSVGIVIYRALSGKHPFLDTFGIGRTEAIEKMLNAKAKPLHEVNPSVPEQLSEFIMMLIRRDFYERMQSVQFAREQLHRIANELK